ncbi:hypothetical protein [Psychrobacter urativorans]|uniref:hypothetical protein n=1 Tax=Psychrobacter urativorans TaxID=45610 RepID=UPI001919A816|nr:hypothetical protein [Psychrobacter urativorans]
MDKKQLEDMIEPSAMESFNEIQKQIDPLYQIRNSLNISEIVKQHERISSVSSIGEIARKAFQQADLDFTSFANQSTIAKYANLGFEDMVTLQDTVLEARGRVDIYKSVLPITEVLMQNIRGKDLYKDIMASVNLTRKSLEPFKNSIDLARIAFEANESFKLAKESQSQAVLANSLFSEYAGALKQLESLHNLESFKAIARLKNFPFEDMVPIDLDSIPDLEENISETIVELDSEISDELFLVDDFNELSEERRTILLGLYQVYYYPIILNCLVILMWLQVFLDEKLDLTNNTFIFVEKSKEKLSYISNVYRPNPSGVIDGLIGTAIFTLLMKVFG